MEETKTHKTKSGDVSECHGSCLNIHRYCFAGCCLLRTVLGVFLVIAIFGVGYCSGFHEGREWAGGYHEKYRGHMMRYDRDADYLFERRVPMMQSSGLPVIRVVESPADGSAVEVMTAPE